MAQEGLFNKKLLLSDGDPGIQYPLTPMREAKFHASGLDCREVISGPYSR